MTRDWSGRADREWDTGGTEWGSRCGRDSSLKERARGTWQEKAQFRRLFVCLSKKPSLFGEQLWRMFFVCWWYRSSEALACGDGCADASDERDGPAMVRILVLAQVPCEGAAGAGADVERSVWWWNFVGRTDEEIRQAREEWMTGGRFGEVKGYDGDGLRAPEVPVAPPEGAGKGALNWVFLFCADSRSMDAWLRPDCRRDCGRGRMAAPSATM
ncbi:hypothetical protein [Streptomyces zaomyceticus]|uniref:hypothetical protein n=1 Tax=Streptomyces zaomyceticus TaxID=68286 RepID=UPI003F4E21F8